MAQYAISRETPCRSRTGSIRNISNRGGLAGAGTWKLSSERFIEGNAPSFPQRVVMKLDDSSRVAKFDKRIPSSVVGHTDKSLPVSFVGNDRIKTKVSPDGRTLTWDTAGVDAKSVSLGSCLEETVTFVSN
jgi:hypothetical protein